MSSDNLARVLGGAGFALSAGTAVYVFMKVPKLTEDVNDIKEYLDNLEDSFTELDEFKEEITAFRVIMTEYEEYKENTEMRISMLENEVNSLKKKLASLEKGSVNNCLEKDDEEDPIAANIRKLKSRRK